MLNERYVNSFKLLVISSIALPLFVSPSDGGLHKVHASSRCRLVCLFLIILFFSVLSIQAQDDDNPKRGFNPGGSYAISQIETINKTDGNVMLNIPLASLPPGRTGLNATVYLTYNSKLWNSTSTRVYDQYPEFDVLLYTEHELEVSE